MKKDAVLDRLNTSRYLVTQCLRAFSTRSIMSSFKAILKSPKKALRNALSSGRSSTPESSTPPPLSCQAELAPTPVISQVGVFDAKGATLTNIGRDQINVQTNVQNAQNIQNISYHGICTHAYPIVLRSVCTAHCH